MELFVVRYKVVFNFVLTSVLFVVYVEYSVEHVIQGWAKVHATTVSFLLS